MAEKTGIEWTDATWNPVRGCSRVSEGCRNCYAEKVAARFSDPGQAFHSFAQRDRPGSKWTGRVNVIWQLLDLPLRWTKPRRIFVNSMSDLFHENLDWSEIATVFAVAVAAHHLRGHTFQVLTKRSYRMRSLLNDLNFWDQVNAEASMHVMEGTDPLNRRSDDARATLGDYGPDNPPPGIWLGVSSEDQPAADDRIDDLVETPAAVRFVSYEPALGPVDLSAWLGSVHHHPDNDLSNSATAAAIANVIYAARRHIGGATIDWVICGGESGPGARPMHPDWARSVRDQCAAAGVPFFFKQWGEWCDQGLEQDHPAFLRLRLGDKAHVFANGQQVGRVGKRAAGNLLDGRQCHEFPDTIQRDPVCKRQELTDG